MITIVNLLIIFVNYIQSQNEFHVKDDYVPSFLKYQTMNITKIIPFDFQINISVVSRLVGTLLYATDANNNQLILSLQDGIVNRLEIEFLGQKSYLPLEQLCGCKRCKYQWLSLHLKIDSSNILVKCNKNEFPAIQYAEKKKTFNRAYPAALKSHPPESINAKAVIYLINTPHIGNVYPNNEQLRGCIKDVLFNGESITPNRCDHILAKNCTRACDGDPCNGGNCYETFSHPPMCDCSNTYLNGPFCNNSMINGSISFDSIKPRKFKCIKLTWNSNLSKFVFGNKKFKFWINCDNELSIQVKYDKENQSSQVVKGTFSSYNACKINITMLIITFNDASIHFRLNSSLTNVTGEFAVPINIGKEIFTTLQLEGDVDLVYKGNPLHYTWDEAIDPKRMNMFRIDEYEPQNTTAESSKVGKPSKPYTWKYIVIALESVAILISIILLIKEFVIPKIFKQKSGENNEVCLNKRSDSSPNQNSEDSETSDPLV